MTRTLLILGALSLLLVAPSKTGATTAGELSAKCSNETAPAYEICVGFIMGWSEELGYIDEPINNGKLVHFYFEDGVTIGQIMRVFLKYVKDHPEKENQPAIVILFNACSEAKILKSKNL
jgi:hypothetical protein